MKRNSLLERGFGIGSCREYRESDLPIGVKMVCLACLLPLFLVPIVNLLPLIFDFIMARVYGLFGWEYRKPERAPPACPMKPSSSRVGASNPVTGEQNHASVVNPSAKSVAADTGKID